jgi:hypothetical protein
MSRRVFKEVNIVTVYLGYKILEQSSTIGMALNSVIGQVANFCCESFKMFCGNYFRGTEENRESNLSNKSQASVLPNE